MFASSQYLHAQLCPEAWGGGSLGHLPFSFTAAQLCHLGFGWSDHRSHRHLRTGRHLEKGILMGFSQSVNIGEGLTVSDQCKSITQRTLHTIKRHTVGSGSEAAPRGTSFWCEQKHLGEIPSRVKSF